MRADEAVKFLATLARPLILQTFSRDSCIASTAVACDFCEWAGVHVRPLEVEVMAWNALALEQLAADVPFEQWPADAWSVGVKQNTPDTHRKPRGRPWSGAHLVAIVDRSTLLDLSADQLSRPIYRMPVPGPVVLPWDGIEARAVNDETGVQLMYRVPVKPDLSFRSSPDWRLRGRRQHIVSELVRLARLVGAEQ